MVHSISVRDLPLQHWGLTTYSRLVYASELINFLQHDIRRWCQQDRISIEQVTLMLMLISRGFHYFHPWQPKGWNDLECKQSFCLISLYVMFLLRRKLTWREVELSLRAMQFSPLASVWSKLCSTGKFRGIPGVQALFVAIMLAACRWTMLCHWFGLWLIKVWNVVMAWNYARGNAIPGRGASAWNFGGFPSLAIRCVCDRQSRRVSGAIFCPFCVVSIWWQSL